MQRAPATRAGQLVATCLSSAAASRGASRLLTTRAVPSLTATRQTNAWASMSVALHSSLRFASSSSSAASATHTTARSHYRCLGIDTDATPQEVKAAYRQLALRYHPDVAADEHRAQAEFLFRRVSEAYEVLSDPVKRRAHDSEIGVQTRRKQTPSSAEAAASSRSASAPQGRGATTQGSRRRRRSAAASSTTATQQQQSGKRYRKPFVRGDANRVFADAFDGKTLDEILFDVQRRRRQQAAMPSSPTAAASSSTAAASSADDLAAGGALDREARLRHVMEDAAASFAVKAQRQYGHGILRHIRAAASPLPAGPSPPPEAYMPFRPFVGMEVPAGVRAPPEPQQGPVLSPEAATLVSTEAEGAKDGGDGGGVAAVPGYFHTHRYADGVLHSRMSSLDKAAKNVGGMAHNMGQLYSYQRPY